MFDFFVYSTAYLIMLLELPMGALVFLGMQGTGKSLLWTLFGHKILGEGCYFQTSKTYNKKK